MRDRRKVTNVLVVGVGGQGVIVASKLLTHVVLKAGFDVNPAILENWEEHTGLLMRKYEGKPEFEESFFHID